MRLSLIHIYKSDVKGPHAVESPVLGVISPEKLSGGTKTLLLMANDPEKVFNASTCGDNCAPFILKLAKKKDLTINLRHLMDFGKKKFPVDVKVLNTGDVVHSMEAVSYTHLQRPLTSSIWKVDMVQIPTFPIC